MKVNIFYLSLPTKLDDYFPTSMVEDFKLVIGNLKSLRTFYNDKTDKWVYLYGFTNKKENAKIFEDMHDMKLFTKITKNMDKDIYEQFKKDNKMAEITKYSVETNKSRLIQNNKNYPNDIEIVCTKNEIYDFDESFTLYLNEELTLNSIIPYCMFKTKYIKALDLIMYCTNNRVNSEYDNDYYSYQASFGFTAEGYAKGQVYMIPDIISLYLRIYKLLLRKEK